jgi:hypothetical protein
MQIYSKLLRSIALAALALVVVSTARADSPPRWKFKTGESLNYVLERAAEGKVTMMGAAFEFKMGMAFDTTWQVKGVESDGTASVEQTVDRIQINMSSPLAGSVNYDSKSSEKPGAGPVWTLLEPVVTGMLGQTFKVKISPLGKVTDIELPAKLSESFAKQRVGQNRQAGLGIGGNAFTERGVKELLTRAVVLLPEAAGKDWTQSFDNPIPFIGRQTAEITFSLAGTEDVDGKKLEKIVTKTELMFEPEENPRAELEITAQEGSGLVYFDAQAGRMVKASSSQSSALEMSGPQELTQEVKETSQIRMGKSPDKPLAAETKDAKPASKTK